MFEDGLFYTDDQIARAFAVTPGTIYNCRQSSVRPANYSAAREGRAGSVSTRGSPIGRATRPGWRPAWAAAVAVARARPQLLI